MFLRHLTPMLGSSKMKETVEFYTSKLGFRLNETFEHDGILHWCSLYRDHVWLMFSGREDDVQSRMDGVLYLYPSNVEALWEEVKDRVEIVASLCDTDYHMREFSIKDINGYVLSFGQDLQPNNAFDKWFPPRLVLETDKVQLRILRQSDSDALKPLTRSDTTWKYFTRDLGDEEGFKQWMTEAASDYGSGKRVPFVIIDKKQNRIAGSTSYGSISFFDKRIEIGWSWLGDEFKGSGINTHAKFLLLRHAFDVMELERVEIKTDNLNERAKAALLKIGARPEGVLRSHMQMHSNRRRDSIYYSILKGEWAKVKEDHFGGIV